MFKLNVFIILCYYLTLHGMNYFYICRGDICLFYRHTNFLSKTNRFPIRSDVELLFLEKSPPFIEDKSEGLVAFIISFTY